MSDTPIGTRYKSKNGLIGKVIEVGGVKMLEVRNSLDRITQTIILRKINLKKFERCEDA